MSPENQSKEQVSAGHGFFNTPFTQIFLASQALLHMRKRICILSTLKLTGSLKASRCPFPIIVFCNFKSLLVHVPNVTPLIMIPIKRTSNTRAALSMQIINNDPLAPRSYMDTVCLALCDISALQEHCSFLLVQASVFCKIE